MPRKKYKPAEIVAKLSQVDVPVSQGSSVADAIRQIGVSEVWLARRIAQRRIFYTLREAKIIIESWRRHYNAVRPHAFIGYKPPAPEVFVPAFTAWPASPAMMRRTNNAKSRNRSRVEHVFAEQKDRMKPLIRTIGFARTTIKIGMVNLVYNIKRLLYLRRIATA
jgi:hypothetical protein